MSIIIIVNVIEVILDFIICKKYYKYLKDNYKKKFKEIDSPKFISFYSRGPYRDSKIFDKLSQDNYMKKLINYSRNLLFLSVFTSLEFMLDHYVVTDELISSLIQS